MEISNNTFSAAIRKYENEIKAEETEEIQDETPATVKEFAEQQAAQSQTASNPSGDCFVRTDGEITTISNIDVKVVESAENVDDTQNMTAAKYASMSSYSSEELNYIKQLIYNSHHSFIANFMDADSFFDYVNTKKNSAITKTSGITRSQLIELTQNDDWEDSHKDFFGSLNRSFYSLDNDDNGTLSYSEVKEFLNTYLKKDGYSNFNQQVQAYSNEIQKKFDNAASGAKIDLAIKYTRDYLTAAGLNNQLKALDRLLNNAGEDLWTDADHHRGQISFRDLNPNWQQGQPYTLGAYSSSVWPIEYTNSNSNTKPSGRENSNGSFTQDVGIFASDKDSKDDNDPTNQSKNVDAGIALDISYLDKGQAWEELVATLVHELTHATSYQYSNAATEYKITADNVNSLKNMGVFKTDEEYNLALQNVNELNNAYQNYYLGSDYKWHNHDNDALLQDKYQQFLNKFAYLGAAASGEYIAYQADADYLDSIGGDIFTKGSNMSVDGEDEQQTIIDHIDQCGYNDGGNQPLPDWKWWSYA